MKDTPPALEERKQPGRIRAILLAVAVHAAFFALIVFGVTWQSRPTPPVQAELWDKIPPTPSADPSPPPKVEPEPEPPKPEVKPEPPKPEPPKPEVKPEPPKPDPKIAEKKEREKREAEKREREKVEKQKAEKQKAEDAAKKKREDDKRRKDEEKAKKEAEAAREVAQNARQLEIQGFIDKIRAKVKSKANVPDTVTGNPEVQVRIKILPGGDVLDIAIARSSGNRVYDMAIERAIRSAQPLPVPAADSELFPQFRDITFNIRHER